MPNDDDDERTFRNEALATLGGHVQHTREPLQTVAFSTVKRASCLQCGWSTVNDIEANAAGHVRSFRHAVMVADIELQLISLAPTKDVTP